MDVRWVAAALAVAGATLGSAAAAASPSAEAYGRLPGVELMRLSPDGDKFAFVAVSGEQRKLYVATLAGKFLIVAPVGQTKVLGADWAGDDHLLVTTSSTVDLRAEFKFKYEFASVVQIDVSNSKGFTVFKDEKAIAPVVLGEYGSGAQGGKWYGYFAGISFERSVSREFVFDHGWADLYRVDLQTGRPELAMRGAPDLENWVVRPDGVVAATERYDQRSGRWSLQAGGLAGKSLLERTSALGAIGTAGLGRTPDTVVVVDNTGDRSTVEEVSLKDGATSPILGDVEATGFIHDPATGLLIGAATVGEPGAVFFDPKLEAAYTDTRKAFPEFQMRLASFSQGLGRLIVETEGTGDSGTYWIVDIASGHAQPIGRLHPDIKPADVGPVSVVKFKASDGLQMDGVLTLPPGRPAKNLPLVVMPHGGPIGISDTPGFDSWAQAFASRGYAVFQPNYRGSSGHGVAFRQAGYGEWGRKMLSDMKDGMQALADQGLVDPKRACIVGASYGGYAALAGVTLQHGLYRCAVSVSGPADMGSFFDWEVERRGLYSDATRYWRAATGMDKGGSSVLKAISPAAHAADADAPILLIHGRDDTVVPVEQSRAMEAALKRAGKPVELVEISGGDHWELHEDARMATVTGSVAFVMKNNPPD